MKDYLQPDFYRFNEDSLRLVKEILQATAKAESILDMGSGSGVIGLELAKALLPGRVDFLELQKEWAPYLHHNVQDFLPAGIEHGIFWTSFSDWVPAEKYDLIACNPPYYLPGKGIASPDPVRAKCRSFLEDDWEILLAKCLLALRPQGKAWFVAPRENKSLIEKIPEREANRFQFVWI